MWLVYFSEHGQIVYDGTGWNGGWVGQGDISVGTHSYFQGCRAAENCGLQLGGGEENIYEKVFYKSSVTTSFFHSVFYRQVKLGERRGLVPVSYLQLLDGEDVSEKREKGETNNFSNFAGLT